MARTYYTGANVDSTTDTFAQWLSRTNDIVFDMSTVVVTVAADSISTSTNGTQTSGNGHIDGIFSSDTMVINTALRGGDVTNSPEGFANSHTLYITSNTEIGTSLVPDNLLVYGTLDIRGNSTLGNLESVDRLAVNSWLTTDFEPESDSDFDLGDPSRRWSSIYVENVVANTSFTMTSTSPVFEIENTNADATVGPEIDLYRNSASPAANDLTGNINFDGKDLGGNRTTYAAIASSIFDPTNGSEDGVLRVSTVVAGTSQNMITVNETGSQAVTLAFNGSEKLATKTDGVDVTGELQADSLDVDGVWDIFGIGSLHANTSWDDGARIRMGGAQDLMIYHDGSNSIVEDQGTGSLILRGTSVLIADSANNTFIDLNDTGAGGVVTLKNLGLSVLNTKVGGVNVTGEIEGDTLNIDGVADILGNTSLHGTLAVDSNLSVNTNKFNVTASNGNTSIAGTLGVTGNVSVNTNKFNVTASNGNVSSAGTLTVSSATTLNSTLSVSNATSIGGTLSVTEAATLANTLSVTNDFSINTNKFNVTASNGNTSIAGTLTVTGDASNSGTISISDTTEATQSVATWPAQGSVTASFLTLGGAGITKRLYVGGDGFFKNDVTITGDLVADTLTLTSGTAEIVVATSKANELYSFDNAHLESNVFLGTETSDEIHFGGRVKTDVLPLDNNSYDLGSSSLKWAEIHATSFTGALTGNASTATTLQTTRTINDVNFNGSANITVEPYIENDESSAAWRYLTFTDTSTAGFKRLNEDSELKYYPSTGTLYTTIMQSTTQMTSPLYDVTNQGDVRFFEASANGTNYVALQAPANLAANWTLTLPADNGTSEQYLKTDGNGNTSWDTVATTLNVSNGSTSTGVALLTESLKLVAGTGVGVAVNTSTDTFTFSIGQAVATNSNVTFNTVTASTFTGALAGNASTASKWANSRTLSLTGAVTGSASIDGSGNVSLNTTATNDPTLTITGDASGTATFTNLGNATLSLSLTKDPTITLTGDVTGSAQMTNLGNVTITTAVGNDSHTHDTRYVRLNTSTLFTSGSYQFLSSNDGEGTGDGATLQVYQDNAGEDAYMSFHVSSDYAFHFGLDGTTNDLFVGGWSMGAVKYKVWHAGNDGASSGLNADLLDGQHGSFYQNASNINAGTISDARLPDSITSNITGNAATASKWQTARSLTLTGAVTGSASIDGSGNVSLATTATSDPTLTLSGDASGSATFTNLGNATLSVTVANDSHTHDGRYYTEGESDARFLGISAKAADSNLLDGINSTSFIRNDTTAQQTLKQGLRVNVDNTAGIGLILSDDGDFVDLNDGYGSMRFSNGIMIHSGNKTTGARIALKSDGQIICSSNVTAYGSPSDIRLKENIEKIPNALDKVMQLGGYTFNYKKDPNRLTGVIAQEVEKVLPEAIYTSKGIDDEEEHLVVRYGNMVGLLVEAIKDLKSELDELKAKYEDKE